DDEDLARHYGVANPFGFIEFDIVLDPAEVSAAPKSTASSA
ncbi:MAG: hypothetical protein JWR34_6554, partial [Mycobacterium sp.]|nr:hypothetical protein [Mycobacterium sp.]